MTPFPVCFFYCISENVYFNIYTICDTDMDLIPIPTIVQTAYSHQACYSDDLVWRWCVLCAPANSIAIGAHVNLLTADRTVSLLFTGQIVRVAGRRRNCIIFEVEYADVLGQRLSFPYIHLYITYNSPSLHPTWRRRRFLRLFSPEGPRIPDARVCNSAPVPDRDAAVVENGSSTATE